MMVTIEGSAAAVLVFLTGFGAAATGFILLHVLWASINIMRGRKDK
jgi:hypothetical protein